MILRFRTRDGTYRVQADTDWFFTDVLHDLETQLPPHEGELYVSSSPQTPGEPVSVKFEQTLLDLGIKNGDMFFVSYNKPAYPSNPSRVKQNDELDLLLSNDTGRINRPQTHLCTHGPNGMCEYCQPLEPFSADYQKEHGIKHLSMHAYYKQLQEEGGILEEPDYKVKSKCRNGHAPWPFGYCSSCQPSAITLQQQKFRMVDHVEFMSPKIIEQFIEFWRSTNQQRVGFLIGKFLPYDGVPLGIKAQVHAIWEPPQQDDVDSLFLESLPTPHVLKTCELLEMSVLGLIFTDLVDLGDHTGKVLSKRHENSYFLTSLEVQLAAKLQNETRHTFLGTKFSSRFVTACISGNINGDIDVACYQTSVQAEALVDADLVVPSTNPSVMRIKEPTKERYVPEVFYKRINEYKLAVLENAKPSFPVDYLLLSLSHGFKLKQQDIPTLADLPSFTIENRKYLRGQTRAQLADKLNLKGEPNFAILMEFHCLLYLVSLDILNAQDLSVVRQIISGLENGGGLDDALINQLAASSGIQSLKGEIN